MASDERLSPEERNFADQVKKEREDRGWTQEDLAEKMRHCHLPYVNQSTVSRIENGTRPVRLMESQALALIFNRTVYSMTNPDGREFLLNLIEMNDRAARQHYVRFKEELYETALAQVQAMQDLEELDRLYGDPNEVLDPDLASKVANVRLNRTNFARMFLFYEAAAIISSIQPEHEDQESSSGDYGVSELPVDQVEIENWTFDGVMTAAAFDRFTQLIFSAELRAEPPAKKRRVYPPRYKRTGRASG